MKMMIVKFLVLLAYWFITIQSMKISPCKVQKTVLEPQFGISAKTKKLVDIVQAPAFLSQKVQADICLDTDNTFSRSVLPSVPQFMCRQRYTLVEVYIKPQGDFDAIGNEKPNGDQKTNEFIKEFIFTEAGCEIFINFPSMRRFPESITTRTNLKAASSLSRSSGIFGESIENVGITGINPQQLPPIFDALEAEKLPAVAELHLDSDHNLKPRSMIKSDFFRKGMHLCPPDVNTTDNLGNHQKSSNEKSNSDTNFNFVVPGSEEGDALVEGEIRLSPENIGLPIFILEPSIDPIMKIISQYSIK